jgi:hypothetical protein
LKNGYHLQFNFQYLTNDQTKNFPFSEAPQIVNELLLTHVGFRKMVLQTNDTMHELTLKRYKPTHAITSASLTTKPIAIQPPVRMEHDRSKTVFIPTNALFLEKLSVVYTDRKSLESKVKVGMADKYHQINKFIETIDHLVCRFMRSQPADNAATSAQIVDMGCGKGYLTFATHYHLHNKLANLHTVGVEVRPNLVSEINLIARSLGSEFTGLEFVAGRIADYSANTLFTQNRSIDNVNKLKMLIALHACDTATDDVLHVGVLSKADIIVVAPCCQKQLRNQIVAHKSMRIGLQAMLEHGVYRERYTEMVTDTLRALCLRLCGYEVKVFEFIDMQHTPKNVMITAIRSERPADVDGLKKQIQDLMVMYGVSKHQLVRHLQLFGEDDGVQQVTKKNALLSRKLRKML